MNWVHNIFGKTCLISLLGLMMCHSLNAQELWPNKPIKLILPFQDDVLQSFDCVFDQDHVFSCLT
jgi:energy-converting hydrogenase Eha subunit F